MICGGYDRSMYFDFKGLVVQIMNRVGENKGQFDADTRERDREEDWRNINELAVDYGEFHRIHNGYDGNK